MVAKARRPKRVGSDSGLKKRVVASKRSSNPSKRTSKNSEQYNRKRNEVRKAQKRIVALQRKLTSAVSPAAQRQIQAQIDAYRTQVESVGMYSKETGRKVRSRGEIAQNLVELARMNERYGALVNQSAAARQRRSNKMTESLINIASVSGPTVSPYSRDQVQIFYRATQKAWQNTTLENRNEAILRYYGETSLQDIFEKVVNDPANKDLQRAIAIVNNPVGYTDDDEQWAMDVIADNEDEYTVSGQGEEALPPVQAPGM